MNISFNIKNINHDLIEAFGITKDYTYKIVEDFNPKYDIEKECLFITGESGSGKSLLLKSFNSPIIKYEDIPQQPIIEWIKYFDISFDKFSQYLSGVGLCDVKLFTKQIQYLSESQKYRAMILYGIIKYDVIILDEFLTTLDRKSAKPIAFAFQKLCRRLNKRFIVASAHDDILEYLKPDRIWRGEAFTACWKEEIYSWKINYPDEIILTDIPIKGIGKHYLLKFHYQEKMPGNLKDSSIITINNKDIGIIVIGGDLYGREPKYVRRLVIHPSYRGCGFTKILIDRYKQKYEQLRIMSKMLNVIPFIQGQEYDYKYKPKKEIIDYFKPINFIWNNLDSCIELMKNKKYRDFLSNFYEQKWNMYMQLNNDLTEEHRINMIKKSELVAGTILYYIRPRKTPGFKL